MIRAVLDANVLVTPASPPEHVAAIRAGGKPDQILHQAGDRFIWLTSAFIVSEVAAVLGRKHIQAKYQARVTREERTRFLAEIQTLATAIVVTTVVTAVHEDVKDNPVLACGVDGRADYVVTGDRHLLELGTYEGLQIMTPEQFLRELDIQA